MRKGKIPEEALGASCSKCGKAMYYCWEMPKKGEVANPSGVFFHDGTSPKNDDMIRCQFCKEAPKRLLGTAKMPDGIYSVGTGEKLYSVPDGVRIVTMEGAILEADVTTDLSSVYNRADWAVIGLVILAFILALWAV